jgi:CheY-like chemotaxis protein
MNRPAQINVEVQPTHGPTSPALLVIEDSESMRCALRHFLEHAGFGNLEFAVDAQSGARALARRRFDVVVCDNNLGLDSAKGWELYEQWQASYHGRWLLFTAHPWDIPQLSGLRILDKIEPDQLVAALRALTPPAADWHSLIVQDALECAGSTAPSLPGGSTPGTADYR